VTKPSETHVEAPAVAAKNADRFLPPASYRHLGDLIRLLLAGLLLAAALAINVADVRGMALNAVSALQLHRPATYWLPVAPGWLSRRALQRREYL